MAIHSQLNTRLFSFIVCSDGVHDRGSGLLSWSIRSLQPRCCCRRAPKHWILQSCWDVSYHGPRKCYGCVILISTDPSIFRGLPPANKLHPLLGHDPTTGCPYWVVITRGRKIAASKFAQARQTSFDPSLAANSWSREFPSWSTIVWSRLMHRSKLKRGVSSQSS